MARFGFCMPLVLLLSSARSARNRPRQKSSLSKQRWKCGVLPHSTDRLRGHLRVFLFIASQTRCELYMPSGVVVNECIVFNLF